MGKDILIKLNDITKQYILHKSDSGILLSLLFPAKEFGYKKFTALDKINLEVNKGEILGIIGRNGSGKSTLLKIIAGITAPTSGSFEVNGSIVPLFELGAGFHKELTGRENLYYYTIMQNFDKQVREEIIEQAIEFAEIDEFIDQPIRTYSRGMRSRLAFAISVFVNADILIIDEVLSVGDAYFKEKSYEKLHELLVSGKTIVLVTHSEKEIKKVCTRAVMLEKGKVVFEGNPEEVIKKYHPKKKKLED